MVFIAMVIALVSQFMFQFPLAYILAKHTSLAASGLWWSFPIANVVIAFSPGAQDTMMVLALALHLDPIYVGAHHLARFLVVTISIAVGARRLAQQTSLRE